MLPDDRGLDADGFVRREGDPSRVQPVFADLVRGYVAAVRSLLGADLDSVYLYGSIPRGTARPGLSDLDGQVLLTRSPTEDDHRALEVVKARLRAAYPQVSTVEILVDARSALVDPADRHDGGFHVRVLCTPFWGPDAGREVAPHRPDLDLARGVQGDWRGALTRLREQAGGAGPGSGPGPTEEVAVCRATGRRLARIAFSWVLPRWGGWSSDPAVMTRVVSHLEPGWAAPMATAVRLGWGGPGMADLATAGRLLTAWGDELAGRGERLGA
ncbi:nucleotidyltransferase domain-containing protein [Ornithinimicrobium flavum]|uniref:nucleotidyltransferase domain-containing protein n=1 Tax=Ornithinimicrobium flavum TaxID=1288636 RepID=UPI001070534A|nr:nucleotidyltransferase domain-containing protein [Ornithinimicrobium flavum]